MNTKNELLFDRFFTDTETTNKEYSSREQDAILLTHLQRILNTRKQYFMDCSENDENCTLANYGLLDFGQVNPRSNQDKINLQHAIENTLEKYEPRLHDVQVTVAESDAFNMGLCFTIKAKIDSPEKSLSLFLQLDPATHQAKLEQMA